MFLNLIFAELLSSRPAAASKAFGAETMQVRNRAFENSVDDGAPPGVPMS